MIDHPLFNDDPEDKDRRQRDIGFIQIVQFKAGKRVQLTGTWTAEELQTVDDLFAAVGPGKFELTGRSNNNHRIVDKVMIEIAQPRSGPEEPQFQAPQGGQRQWQPPEPPQPQKPPEPPPNAMRIGDGVTIPAGMDPNMAMFAMMVQSQAQTSERALLAAREDARANSRTMSEMFVGFMNAQGQMVTGLAQAFAGRGGGGGAAGGQEEGFLKGIETMAQLSAGLNEGREDGKPTDWASVVQNIATGLRSISSIANATGAGVPVDPVIPPGEPPA